LSNDDDLLELAIMISQKTRGELRPDDDRPPAV